MNDKLYAQIDSEDICVCVGTPETHIHVEDYSFVGRRYVDGVWSDVDMPVATNQPTNSDIAQQLSDLQADLMIAGVI